MPVKVLWTPQAREDLIEIYCLIGEDQPSAAEQVIDSIERRVGTLSQYPHLGVRRPDIRSSTRILIERPYLILYETHPDTDEGHIDAVEIVRIVDGRRDVPNLF